MGDALTTTSQVKVEDSTRKVFDAIANDKVDQLRDMLNSGYDVMQRNA